MSHESLFAQWRERIEQALIQALNDHSSVLIDLNHTESQLEAALHYALLGGGKRLRPLLVYASGQLCNAPITALDNAAVAIEMVHTYSLIHDDLPAMDDDTLRRGQPTTHIAFSEATAILAGDALQSLAFSILARTAVPPTVGIELIKTLADAAGRHGMCGGQSIDIQSTGQSLTIKSIEKLHQMKTGALIRAAVRIGGLIGAADAMTFTKLDQWAAALGLAFQIRDDLLDIESTDAALGKTAGKDQAQNKSTFPALLGIEQSQQRLQQLAAQMHECLQGFGQAAEPLQTLADFVIVRKN